MHKYMLAYKHDNGDIEGFVGLGFTKAAAREDAINDIRKKLRIIGELNGETPILDHSCIIEDAVTAAKLGASMKEIQADWNVCAKNVK